PESRRAVARCAVSCPCPEPAIAHQPVSDLRVGAPGFHRNASRPATSNRPRQDRGRCESWPRTLLPALQPGAGLRAEVAGGGVRRPWPDGGGHSREDSVSTIGVGNGNSREGSLVRNGTGTSTESPSGDDSQFVV